MNAKPIISHILLPVDLSEGSRGAADVCSGLAKALGEALERVTILYVNPMSRFGRHIGYVDFRGEEATHDEQFRKVRDEHVRRDILPLMEQAAGAIETAAPAVQVDRMIVDGDPAEEIVRVADDGDYSVIVMATRGLSEIKRLFLGSVTNKVIGHAKCDVLAVPPGARFESGTILVPTDGSPHSMAAAEQGVGLAKLFRAQLIVISASPSGPQAALDLVEAELPVDLVAAEGEKEAERSVRAVQQLAKREGINARGLVLSGPPYSAIVDMAKKQGAGLIVMGSHGRSGIDRFLMGSVTERVLNLSSCPVLVVKTVH